MKALALFLLTLQVASAEVPKMSEIHDPAEKVVQLATDMKFTEGPVWIPSEKKVIWSDIPNSAQMEWSEAGGFKKFRDVEQSNGNLLDLDGRILSCQHAGRNVIRTEKDGTITVLASEFDGMKLNSPNDLCIHSDGTIYFTDPSYGLKGKKGEIEGKWVYRLDTDGKVSVIYKGFDMPNGIAFSPDEKVLYIADTGKVGTVRAFRAPKAGEMLGDPTFELQVRCDGMCVDVKGNIYLTSEGGIHVHTGDGRRIGIIKTAEKPANVCFGGPNYDTLFITARKSLYSVKVLNQGAKPSTAKW